MDGDQVTCKIVFSVEANKELEEYLNSAKFYIDLGGNNIRSTTNEGIQSLYNLTLVLPETKDKLEEMVF